MSMKKYDVIIVGGGVSGMTCAVQIKNKKVLILEGNDRVGKKLLSTGNGKCNLMNKNLTKDKYNDEDFWNIFEKFTLIDIESFYKKLGLSLRFDDEGRGYPLSESANTVLDAYRRCLKKENVDIVTGSYVTKIARDGEYIKVTTENAEYFSSFVVIATGSDASFGRDSLGLLSGYATTKTFRPSLVPLISEIDNIKGLNGVRVKCRASLILDGKIKASEYGEVLFKTFGLSGISIFNLSCVYARACASNAYVSLNFLDAEKAEVIKILNEKISLGFTTAEECIDGMFHKMLVQNILKVLDISADKKLTAGDVEKLSEVITNYKIKIVGTGDKSLAQVMTGGVTKASVNKNTLEIKGAKNMFVCGECVDMDGVSGGYNIMWAVVSGMTVANALNEA